MKLSPPAALLCALCFVSLLASCGGGASNDAKVSLSTASASSSIAPTPVPLSTPSTNKRAASLVTTSDATVSSLQAVVKVDTGVTPDPSAYDVLVLNGSDSQSAPVSTFLSAGKTVVFVNASAAHKQAIQTQCGVVTRGDSLAFAVRRTLDPNGRAEFFLYEWPVSQPNASLEFQRGMQAFLTRQNATVGDFSPPAGLIYTTYNYSQTVQPLIFSTTWKGTRHYSFAQVTDLQANMRFRLFLENGQVVTGDRQWVVAESDIQASPTNAAYNSYSLLSLIQGGAFEDDDIGWFTNLVSTSIQPAQSQLFNWQQDSPANANNQTQVISSMSFGLSITSAAGGGSFNYNTQSRQTLTAWAVQNNGSGAYGAWQYVCQDPYLGNDPSRWRSHGFGGGLDGGALRLPNDLSQGQFVGSTKVAWTTQGIIKSAQDFTFALSAQWGNCFAGRFSSPGEDTAATQNSTTFSINLAAIVPIPITSLTFSPAVANPNQNPLVTATLTLQSPALADTTVYLSAVSPNSNATVQPSVIVRQGQSSVTFPIQTNANGVAPGQSVIATIEAFYAGFFQSQLKIQN